MASAPTVGEQAEALPPRPPADPIHPRPAETDAGAARGGLGTAVMPLVAEPEEAPIAKAPAPTSRRALRGTASEPAGPSRPAPESSTASWPGFDGADAPEAGEPAPGAVTGAPAGFFTPDPEETPAPVNRRDLHRRGRRGRR